MAAEVESEFDSIFNDHEKNCFLTENREKYFKNYNPMDFEPHEIAWISGGVATFFAVFISVYLIYKHARNYRNPDHQKLIIRILLMVPIYGIDSFLSFRFYWLSVYFNLVRDCYEAFVINTFFHLMIEYMGGYETSKQVLANRDGIIKLAVPLCCVKISPNRGMLRTLKRATLQYVLIRPLMTVLSAILQAFNLYCPGNWSPMRGNIYITFVLFISVTVAMYALVMFYSLGKEQMAHYKPIGKFLSVKFVIFLSFWQGIVVSGLVAIHWVKGTQHWSTDDVANGIQNILICYEMVICAILHLYVFSHKEYAEEGKETDPLKSIIHAFNPIDVALDVHNSFNPVLSAQRKKQRKQEKEHSYTTDGEQSELLEIATQSDHPSSNRGNNTLSFSITDESDVENAELLVEED